MPPKYFLSYLGEGIDRAKISTMADIMRLSSDERTILLERFCGGNTIGTIANEYAISTERQRRIVKILDSKVKSWILDNLNFFNSHQLKVLSKWIPREYND